MTGGRMLDPLIPAKTINIEKVGARVKSNIHRSADRTIRSQPVAGNRPRRPRRDDETMAAWVLRGARRLGAVPVADPEWRYQPNPRGCNADQFATVRVLRPSTEAERVYFTGLRLPDDLRVFRYIDPDWRPDFWTVS